MGRQTKRPRAELVDLLAQHRQALAASCENFDRGNDWECARLATTVFTLVHDGGKIESILTQLGQRASLKFVSSGRLVTHPGLVLASPPLLMMRFGGGGPVFGPKLADGPPGIAQQVQFSTWWDKEPIFWEKESTELTRKRLVFALRHQDGGGHVGNLTDPAYVRFKSGAGWFVGHGNGPGEPVLNMVAATMRQVAWEMTETLKQLGEVT